MNADSLNIAASQVPFYQPQAAPVQPAQVAQQPAFAGGAQAVQATPTQQEGGLSLGKILTGAVAVIGIGSAIKTHKTSSIFAELNKSGSKIAEGATGEAAAKLSETHNLSLPDTFLKNLNPLNWLNHDNKAIEEAANEAKLTKVGESEHLFTNEAGDSFFRTGKKFSKLEVKEAKAPEAPKTPDAPAAAATPEVPPATVPATTPAPLASSAPKPATPEIKVAETKEPEIKASKENKATAKRNQLTKRFGITSNRHKSSAHTAKVAKASTAKVAHDGNGFEGLLAQKEQEEGLQIAKAKLAPKHDGNGFEGLAAQQEQEEGLQIAKKAVEKSEKQGRYNELVAKFGRTGEEQFEMNILKTQLSA